MSCRGYEANLADIETEAEDIYVRSILRNVYSTISPPCKYKYKHILHVLILSDSIQTYIENFQNSCRVKL